MLPQVRERIIERFEKLKVDGTISSLIHNLKHHNKIKAVELDFPRILASIRDRFELLPEQASRYVSSILYGAIAGLVDFDEDSIRLSIERRFGGREILVEQNIYLIDYVSDLVKGSYGSPYRLRPSSIPEKEFVVGNGNEIVAIGKMLGGLRYQSYYPITPAADESFFIESHQNLKPNGEELGSIIVLQTEDEIAAITSAIGATLTGARSATATSGPGFSLMVEGLGWAGINEVPVVITYYQRSGPGTGQATRGSQADLLSTLFASHGEFARIVIASGDHEEAFLDSIKAFNLAERYQVPVIHLLDKFLANSMVTMPLPDLSSIRIERGDMVKNPGESYKRFSLSKTLSPRAVLGSKAIIEHSGAEHDESGHTNEDPVNRRMMYEKRLKKLELTDLEIPDESRAVYYGPEKSDYLLVGWGYAKMVALDALEELGKQGYRGSYLHIKMFSPFPARYVKSIINGFPQERVISLEHNYQAQASMIVSLYTITEINRSIVKYTGRPMYLDEVVEAVKKILEGDEKRVVLSRGA
jgi:2-oxoglutarate ferredoxin oxidoreductase subunit alpha